MKRARKRAAKASRAKASLRPRGSASRAAAGNASARAADDASLPAPSDGERMLRAFSDLAGVPEGVGIASFGLGPEWDRFLEVVRDARAVVDAVERGKLSEFRAKQDIVARNPVPIRRLHLVNLVKECALEPVELTAAHRFLGSAWLADPAFSLLDKGCILAELAPLARPRDRGARKGDLIGPVGVAVRLTIHAGAFGAARGDFNPDAVERVRKSFELALKKV